MLNGRPHTLVGVMPRRFNYPPGGVELWAPLAFGEQEQTERDVLSLRVIGRLAPGIGARRGARRARWRRGERLARPSAQQPGRSFAAVRLREQQAGLPVPSRRSSRAPRCWCC